MAVIRPEMIAVVGRGGAARYLGLSMRPCPVVVAGALAADGFLDRGRRRRIRGVARRVALFRVQVPPGGGSFGQDVARAARSGGFARGGHGCGHGARLGDGAPISSRPPRMRPCPARRRLASAPRTTSPRSSRDRGRRRTLRSIFPLGSRACPSARELLDPAPHCRHLDVAGRAAPLDRHREQAAPRRDGRRDLEDPCVRWRWIQPNGISSRSNTLGAIWIRIGAGRSFGAIARNRPRPTMRNSPEGVE